MDTRQVTIRVPAQIAFELRFVLPVVAEGLKAIPDGDTTVSMFDQAIEAIDRALPADLRDMVDERQIAEYRMNAVDAQRAAGVRPAPNRPIDERNS